MIWKNQAEYYKAIEKSTDEADSGIFVEFMLEIILEAVKSHSINDIANDTANDTVKIILSIIKENPFVSYEELALKTGKSRITISRKISELKKNNVIKRVGADKNGYWEITGENAK